MNNNRAHALNLSSADSKPSWCPGCGNYIILRAMNELFKEQSLDTRRMVLVSGIGQAAKLPHYPDMQVNVFNGLHGRAIPAATGIKLANHKLQVVITSGDGDMYGEGGNHLIHAMRRNIGIRCFVHNNQVYGLTKGQASPTSDIGFLTKIQSHGVISGPFNPIATGIIEDVSFVARASTSDPPHLKQLMAQALEADGLALLDILQPCVTFNKINTLAWYKHRAYKIGEDHDPYDRLAALKLSFEWQERIPIGVIYRSRRKSFESQIDLLRDKALIE